MSSKKDRLANCVSTIVIALAAWPCCFAQSVDPAPAKTALDAAVSQQRDVLAELARILSEEKVMLSDGAVQAALEALLGDETKQADRIRDLGKQTLGKQPADLTAEQQTERGQLADNQNVYADRYKRLEKGIEVKAGAKPDSVFAKLLLIAEEATLRQKLTDATELIRGNQLGRAMRATNEIVATLREMVNAVSQGDENTIDNKDGSNKGLGFVAPSLRYKAPWEKLAEFSWAGQQVEMLSQVLQAIRRMDELVERQRKVADQTKTRSDKGDQTADNLAKEEWEIRYLALEAGTRVALLDPELDPLIRQACETIVSAIPGMEKGPLSSSVEPARKAVDELQAAAERIKKTWKDVLARLKQYTMDAEQVMGVSGGVPHGMPKTAKQMKLKLVFMMIRATGALTKAIEREQAALDQTEGAKADADLPALKPEQDALAKYIAEEVVPFNLHRGQLSDNEVGPTTNDYDVTFDMLADAIDRMNRTSEALAKPDRQTAVKREQEAIELMTDTLKMMINLLQRLLGQYASQALVPQGGGAFSTFVLDPSGGAGKSGGYLFRLPSEKRETIRQAFSGTFPQRYDRAIKQYYQVIAKE